MIDVNYTVLNFNLIDERFDKQFTSSFSFMKIVIFFLRDQLERNSRVTLYEKEWKTRSWY